MSSLAKGWRIQIRVIGALMIRELATRFGRENIGFLWIMAEPLMFASGVALMWHFMKGAEEHGVGVVAFTVSGYIPLVLFRHAVGRSIVLFTANGSLMHHRQIKVLDFVLVRFLLEFLGHMMAYLFIALALLPFDQFPIPADLGLLLLGWLYYSFFTLSFCFLLAPLSEMSEIMEKIVPVATYLMIPFSGAFNMMAWLAPGVQDVLWYSPPVHAMEMMRAGIFGDNVVTTYDFVYPVAFSACITVVGLALCRKVRKTLVVE